MMTLLIPFVVGLGLSGNAQAAAGNIENGKKVYDQRCEQCHGADGAGDGAAAEFVYPRPRVFKELSLINI